MTPFQAIRATIYMLLAKAREPITTPELIPAPSRARHPRSGTARSNSRHPYGQQPKRRQSDVPSAHTSSVQRIWQAIIASVGLGRAGTRI